MEEDLKLLQAVLNWAVGAGWLDRNPLKGFRYELGGSARRPIVTAGQYEALSPWPIKWEERSSWPWS